MTTVAERIASGNEYVASHIYALEAATVRQLYEAHEQAYREMKAAMVVLFERLGKEAWSPEDRGARDVLLQQIAQQMAALDEQAAQLTLTAAENGYRGGLYGAGWNIDTSLGISAALPLLPTEAIRAQLLAPYEGLTFAERFTDNRADFQMRIKRSLVQSQIQGETVYQAQKRLAEALGIAIGRRTKADRASNSAAFARTELIARTELLRASNNGALATYRANSDILRGWEWKAALSGRTCPECGALDGKVFAFTDRQQPPPLHGRCRCTSLPVLMNTALMNRVAGKRTTFNTWAADKGLTKNDYGQAYELRGQAAPVKPQAA
jgi:SPP1 gp7 family putative phage head morphogenesis protein